MKKFIEVTKIEKEFQGIECDKCGISVENYCLDNDYVNFKHTFGFGTNLDGTEISFELCVKCFLETIKDINYRKEVKF